MTGSTPDRTGGQTARATLSSVAARAGVSPQTVSNVLNSPEIVRAETAARVRAAIRDLRYRPHRAARQLRTRRSHVLGLRIEANSGDAVFDRFLHALTDAATDRDYRVMLYTANDDDAEIAAYSELHDRWDVDGFVLTSTHPGDHRTTYLAERGIPCVTFGRPWDGSGHHPWVDVDGAAGTRAATEHLIDNGRKAIGFLGWPEGPGVGDDRQAGWVSAMAAAGLPTDRLARSSNDLTQGRAAAAEMLNDPAISALVCVSDVLALAAMSEVTARGRRVGKDVAVVGFDDTDVAQVMGLSSVNQPLADVATACIGLITTILDSPAGDHTAEQILLEPELIVRSSSSAG